MPYNSGMKAVIKSSIILFALAAIGYVILAGYVGIVANRDNQKPAEAIVILGAVSYKGDSYNPCLVERVRHGVDLYKTGLAPKIIVSGGTDAVINKNEAETMKEIATKMGVPEDDILTEPKSTSTYENLLYSKEILNNQKLNSTILVSEPFHMARIGMVAQRLNYDYVLSPTQTSVCWLRWKYLSRYFLREPISIVAYWVMGRI